MIKNHQNIQKGFTLIELLVVIFVFCLISGGLIILVSNIFTINRQQGGLTSDIDQARKVAFKLMDELRNAQTGMDGSAALNSAGAQQIIFFSDADSDSAIERIRYYLQTGALYKGVTEFNGTTYNTATEKSTLVQSDVANTSTPLFYYYDDSYSGGSGQNPLVQPVSPLNVHYMKLNLQIYNKGGVKNTNIFTVTAGATVRNLKTNLGN